MTKTGKKRRDWVPGRNLAVSALAWQAARPVLARRSRSWWSVPLRILMAGQGRTPFNSNALPPTAHSYTQETSDDRLSDYAVAVDDASERLTRSEIDHLRATGELPQWFYDDVEELYQAWRRTKRGR
ncbi:hypothetical protein [Actinomadura harenae]|uniref:Uncharacterized protein n=1 Tax=Actinomadura harenae TaxID=2483351 RepID=A0A3M2MED8_9ACTN|nr:hypothetical protein [Actinomadura harenae]RMI47859.1 hypothetical protein EBO15_00785 [Actinomadura harenae]